MERCGADVDRMARSGGQCREPAADALLVRGGRAAVARRRVAFQMGAPRDGAARRHLAHGLRRQRMGHDARAGNLGAERIRRSGLCQCGLRMARQLPERSAARPRHRESRGFLPPYVRRAGRLGREAGHAFDRLRHVERLRLDQRPLRRLQRGQQAGGAVRRDEVPPAGREPRRAADLPLVGRHVSGGSGLLAAVGHRPQRGAGGARQGAPRGRAHHDRARRRLPRRRAGRGDADHAAGEIPRADAARRGGCGGGFRNAETPRRRSLRGAGRGRSREMVGRGAEPLYARNRRVGRPPGDRDRHAVRRIPLGGDSRRATARERAARADQGRRPSRDGSPEGICREP